MCVFFLVRIHPSALFSVCVFFRVRFFPSALFSHALIYICAFFRCAFFLCVFFRCAFFRSPHSSPLTSNFPTLTLPFLNSSVPLIFVLWLLGPGLNFYFSFEFLPLKGRTFLTHADKSVTTLHSLPFIFGMYRPFYFKRF